MKPLHLAALATTLALARAAPTDACEGTPRPICGRTAWLAMSADAVVVHPGDASDVVIPVRLFPYVWWNQTAACAIPAGAQAALEVVCKPQGGGKKITVGPFTVPVGTPDTPGVQDLLTAPGPSPEPGGLFEITIPAGTLPAGDAYDCTVRSEYSVVFGPGTGTGPLLVRAETGVCVVPASPADAAVPLLGLRRLIAPAGDPLLRCRRGDQGVVHYLVENNHPDQGVTLEFEQTSNQVARKPDAVDPDKVVFAISSPKKNTDNFPLGFLDLQDPGVLVDEGDPSQKSDQAVQRALYLAPGELRIVSTVIRSHGMCQDGSCSEQHVRVTGDWDDGSAALACAGAVLMVEDTDPKDPLVEVTDTLKVNDTTKAVWSPAVFDGDPHRTTFAAGNLTGKKDGTQTTGGSLVDEEPFAQTAADYVRMATDPQSVAFTVEAFPQAEGFAKMKMKVRIENLDAAPAPFPPFPVFLFKKPSGANFKLDIDAGADTAVLKEKGKTLFSGTWTELSSTPPAGVTVDTLTCRSFHWAAPTGNYLQVLPPAQSRLFDDQETPGTDLFDVLDPRTFDVLDWNATSSDAAVTLPAPMGSGVPLAVGYSVPATAAFPDTTVAWVTVTNGFAINDPYLLPVATRTLVEAPQPTPMVVEDVLGMVELESSKPVDVLLLQGVLNLPEPLGKGDVVVFQVLGHDYVFRLNKKGIAKIGKKGPRLLLNTGLSGDVPFTLELLKQDLSGPLAALGVHAGVPAGQTVPLLLPVNGRVVAFDMAFHADVPVNAAVQAGGSIDLSLDI